MPTPSPTTRQGDPRAARGTAARRDRRTRQGRQVDAAQRARRRAARAHRRRRVHPHRVVVPQGHELPGQRRAARRPRPAARVQARTTAPSTSSSAASPSVTCAGSTCAGRRPRSTRVTLIDTPGLASLNDENSRRTREFLDPERGRQRRRRRRDLPDAPRALAPTSPSSTRSWIARSPPPRRSTPSPCCRGPTRSAPAGSTRWTRRARIADRYTSDPQIRGLCASVTPLAGLLAETGLTLREDEVANLRTLAATEPASCSSRCCCRPRSSSRSAPATSPSSCAGAARPSRHVRRARVAAGDRQRADDRGRARARSSSRVRGWASCARS